MRSCILVSSGSRRVLLHSEAFDDVKMAKDDRPRKWSDAGVMPDHRFLEGLLQGPLSRELGIVHQPIQQLGSVPRRALGKHAHRLKGQVDDDPGIMDYIDRHLGWVRS